LIVKISWSEGGGKRKRERGEEEEDVDYNERTKRW
jgi:hypothetical protein